MNRKNKFELSEATSRDKKRKQINISIAVAILFTLFYIPGSNTPAPLSDIVKPEVEDTLDQGYDVMDDYVDRIGDTANYESDGSSWFNSRSVYRRVVRIL